MPGGAVVAVLSGGVPGAAVVAVLPGGAVAGLSVPVARPASTVGSASTAGSLPVLRPGVCAGPYTWVRRLCRRPTMPVSAS